VFYAAVGRTAILASELLANLQRAIARAGGRRFAIVVARARAGRLSEC
jgi:hypothetical protein